MERPTDIAKEEETTLVGAWKRSCEELHPFINNWENADDLTQATASMSLGDIIYLLLPLRLLMTATRPVLLLPRLSTNAVLIFV